MFCTACVLVMLISKPNNVFLEYTVSSVVPPTVCEQYKQVNMADPFRHPAQRFECKPASAQQITGSLNR